MSLIPDDLKKEWKSISEKLNSVSGGLGVRCRLIFSEGIQTSSYVPEDSVGNKHRTFMSYGGRSPARSKTGSLNVNEEDSGLKERETTQDFEGRVYAIEKPFEREHFGTQSDKNIYELITKKSLMPALVRAKEAIFNIDLPEKRIKARLLKPPSPYGLGQSVQCKSVWEEV
jgi:hypothetical protein